MPNKTQRRNLAALAIGLENLPKHKRNEHFDMSRFVMVEKQTPFNGGSVVALAVKAAAENFCGTSACAAGWGIVMGIGISNDPSERILAYIRRAYTGDDGDLHDWLFSLHWVAVDNTALGAAARIRYFLKNGVPAIDYRKNPALYAETIAPYRQKSIEKRIKAMAKKPLSASQSQSEPDSLLLQQLIDDEVNIRTEDELETIRKDLAETVALVAKLQRAARSIAPYLRWTIGRDGPGHHPTMPSAVASFLHDSGIA